MRSITALVIAALGSIALVAVAQAADKPGPYIPPPDFKPPSVPVEIMSGWYLRGDLGYRQNTVGSADAAVPVTDYSYDKSAATFGVGAGYKYNFLRADITADFGLPYQYRANTALGTPYYSGKINTTTLLLNGYFDMGTWWGITPWQYRCRPYRSASYNRTQDWIIVPMSDTLSASNFRWSLAYAYTGGASFQFQQNVCCWTSTIATCTSATPRPGPTAAATSLTSRICRRRNSASVCVICSINALHRWRP